MGRARAGCRHARGCVSRELRAALDRTLFAACAAPTTGGDVDGRRYNIEMQVRRYGAWSARTLTQQLNGGDDYQSLKSAIGIHLLDFELFTAAEHQQQAVWCFELRDRVQPELKLGDELQLNLIELPKADRLGAGNPALAASIAFLRGY